MFFNDRRTIKNPAVAAVAKAGSIQATKKSPSKLSQKIAKKMYPAGIPRTPKKGY
jgi:hypothetical protein